MQNKVANFNNNILKREKLGAENRILDIQSELGELAKEVLKSTNYGKKELVITKELELELGDVLYSLLTFADENGIIAEKCLDDVLEKYAKRKSNSGNIGSGK